MICFRDGTNNHLLALHTHTHTHTQSHRITLTNINGMKKISYTEGQTFKILEEKRRETWKEKKR